MRIHPLSSRLALAALGGLFLAIAASAQERPALRLDTRGDVHPHVKREADGTYVFRNRHLVAVLAKEGANYGPLTFYPATRPTQAASLPVAEVPLLLQLAGRAGMESRAGVFTPTQARILKDERLELRGTVEAGGVRWETQAELWIGPAPWLSWEVRTRPLTAGSLARLTPMALRAGHAGPGEALVPGVIHQEGPGVEGPRPLVRRPDDLTIPLMALAQEGSTVALMWDNRQEWGGTGRPGVLFDTPHPDADQDYYRMEVTVPPAARGEGAAAPSLALLAKAEVRLSGKILVLPEEEEPTAAIRQWTEAYGRPRASDLPRGRDAVRRLSRPALLRADAPSETPDAAALPQDPVLAAVGLLADAGRTEGKLRPQVRAQADALIARLRAQGPLDPRLAYRTGGVVESLEAQRSRVLRLIDEQLAGGAWPLPLTKDLPPPSDAAQPPLFRPLEDVTLRALPILRYAAATGDSIAVGSGMRALEYVSRTYRIPTSLQDASETAECFLLGYQTTGERRYMDRARYWADTGLPFVYFWAERERPARLGATLAEIQPEAAPRVAALEPGLEYGRVLRALHFVRPDALYDDLSGAILASGLLQQAAVGGSGELPALWNIEASRAEGPHLGPERLLALMYAHLGYDLGLSHVRTRVGPDRLFVASGATLHEADPTSLRLRLMLRGLEGQDAFTTIHGVLSRPLSVEYNESPLRALGIPLRRSFLPEARDEKSQGWYYDEAAGLLILRLPHTGGDDWVEIRWPNPRERVPVERIDTRIKPRR